MAGEYILDLETVKTVTGAKSDEEARIQVTAVRELLENYLGVTLVKTDFSNEKITVPYCLSQIVQPANSPINSVAKIEILDDSGQYREYKGTFTFGRKSVQFLPKFPALGKVGAVVLSYNAGVYDDYTQVPALLKTAAQNLLEWMFLDPYALGSYQSEHLSDYSYTKGAVVRGIPASIAGILDGVRL